MIVKKLNEATDLILQEATDLILQDPQPDYRAVLRKYADEILPMYLLTVRNGKVEALYGLKTCHEVANGQVLFLIGDRRRNLPPLFRAAGGAAGQYTAFNMVTVNPPPPLRKHWRHGTATRPMTGLSRPRWQMGRRS